MNRTLAIIISLVIVVGACFLVVSIFVPKQADSGFVVKELDSINNKDEFLWSQAYTDTSWFIIPVSHRNTHGKELLTFTFLELNEEGQSELPENISLIVNGLKSSNPFQLQINQINKNIEIGVVANNKDDGTYRYKLDVKGKGFDDIRQPDELAEIAVNNGPAGLKVFLMIFLAVIASMLISWFIFLKKVIYPTFSNRGQLNVTSPVAESLALDNTARKIIIGNQIKEKENFFTKLFFGRIQYMYVNTAHAAVITPYEDFRSKKIVYKIRGQKDTSLTSSSEKSYLSHLDVCSLHTNGEETISFKYFNLKHQ